MELFYHLLPSSTTHELPSPQPSLRRPDLKTVTREWLSLTMDTSSSTPARSLTTTPVPPTPPPLPTDLTPFLAVQEQRATSPAHLKKGFIPPHQPLFTERGAGLGHITSVLPFSQPTSPPPLPPPAPPLPPPTIHSSFTSSWPDSPLRHNSSRRLHSSEAAQTVPVSKPEISTQLPEQHTSPSHVNKSSKGPDIELHVKDPYDELLSMILDGSSNTHHGDISRGPAVSPPQTKLISASQSRCFQKNDEQSLLVAAKPPAVPASGDSPGSVRLEFQKPVTMKPLPVLWGEQSVSLNDPVDAQKPLSIEGKEYTELFIVEEDETMMDKEEDISVFNERLSPQAEVSPSTLTQFPPSGLISPSTPPLLTSVLPPPFPSPSSSGSRSQQYDHIIPPSSPVSPRPPSLPQLTTSPLPRISPPAPVLSSPLHISHSSSDVPSQHSASHPSSSPCLSHPVTSSPISESLSPLSAPSPTKTASPPLSTPRPTHTAPTVPHHGRRSPKVKVKPECRDKD
ncbi:mucin-2-like [Melanotaenia boesemani]|uniref:mucin-2-like n=1 Tax=Melanotaenia boesemani TaxID=1250792 RepID=UPI001C044ED7|nr:mucin-2-like [Melanotaenia boesemani]